MARDNSLVELGMKNKFLDSSVDNKHHGNQSSYPKMDSQIVRENEEALLEMILDDNLKIGEIKDLKSYQFPINLSRIKKEEIWQELVTRYSLNKREFITVL